MKTFKLILISILLIILSGCSPSKKLERLYKNSPYLFEHKVDTIETKVRDTIYLPAIETDSTFSIYFDTIQITKDRLDVKLIRIRDTDTILLEGRCETDTIYTIKTVKIPYNKYDVNIQKNKNITKWWIALGMILIFAILLIINKFKK